MLSLILRDRRGGDSARVVVKVLNKEFPSAEELGRFRLEYSMTEDLDVEGVGNHTLWPTCRPSRRGG